MKGEHYNTTTLSHALSHTKTLSYFNTIKYLLFSLPIYYLLPILFTDITWATYLLFIA